MPTTAQFSNSTTWPQTAVHFRGQAALNGTPSGPKDNQVTLGGFIDSADTNNTLTVYKFGCVVSALPATPDAFVIGKPSTGYFVRGILMQDESILYNEPMKPDGYLLGTPATVMQHGKMLMTDWNTDASGAINPVISSVPIFSTTSGYIEFVAYGTALAPTGFTLLTGSTVTRTDSNFGSTSAGGVEISVDIV